MKTSTKFWIFIGVLVVISIIVFVLIFTTKKVYPPAEEIGQMPIPISSAGYYTIQCVGDTSSTVLSEPTEKTYIGITRDTNGTYKLNRAIDATDPRARWIAVVSDDNKYVKWYSMYYDKYMYWQSAVLPNYIVSYFNQLMWKSTGLDGTVYIESLIPYHTDNVWMIMKLQEDNTYTIMNSLSYHFRAFSGGDYIFAPIETVVGSDPPPLKFRLKFIGVDPNTLQSLMQ